MKQYVIDQLREPDVEAIADYLGKHAEKTFMDGIFWVELPLDLATPKQLEHSSCHPHYFAINLDRNQVAFELLIRSRQIIRCDCIAYATPEQRDFIIHVADEMLSCLDIKI